MSNALRLRMPEAREPEHTRRIQRSTLHDLVQVTRTREGRITRRIPRTTLVGLLDQARLPDGTAAPTEPVVETTERVWRRGSGTRKKETAQVNLTVVFLSAAIAGVLMTAPLWW